MLRIITLLLFLLPASLLAQKVKNYSVVTEELCQKVASTPQPSIRLAVVPFTATKSSERASPAFGEYLTESTIGCLTGNPKIKLFERTRLDAILKEHEFILTDLMQPAAALKIGQLAPIDAIMSGTFTVLKSYIDVSARLIDISSGEVTVSFNERIRITKNIATLLDESSVSQTQTTGNSQAAPVTMSFSGGSNTTASDKSKADICKKKTEEFTTRLHDLSSPDKIEAVVAAATQTPFDNLCGQLHYHVMASFTRFKIDHPGYKSFLLKTIDTIAYPAGDERASEIVRFLASDNNVDEAEWQSGLKAVTRVGNYSLSTYLNYLIGRPSSPDEATKKARVGSFFSLAIAGKVGLPRPISTEVAFFEMMEGVKSNQPLRQFTYEQYAHKLVLDDRSSATMFSTLHSMYKDEKEIEKKTMIVGWLAEFVNKHQYTKAHEQLYDFGYEFMATGNKARDEQSAHTNPSWDLALLVEKSRSKFSEYATMSPYESQTEDRIDFCVMNNIPVPGVIPTLEEADVVFRGTDVNRQLRTAQMLSLMGDKPKKLEATLIEVLNRKSLEDREKLSEVQVQIIVILGNVKTTNTKAIEYMISTLPHYGNDTEASKAALVKIGKPAVRSLTNRLEKTTEMDGGLQYQLITILGKIGPNAGESRKAIQKILNSSRNADVKYAAEAALQAIGE
jgi:TolB-like protein